MTVTAGIHSIPAAAYHADPAEAPSLSAGICKQLLTGSPLHAWSAHPRLNPAYREERKDVFDFGSAAHAALLEGLDICQVVDADDWRTKSARDERDAVREDGKVPLLRKDHERLCELVDTVRGQVVEMDVMPSVLAEFGRPERTLIWQEPNGVWCRARPDWLHADGRMIDDVKTTSALANPQAWARKQLWAYGYDVQAAFYRRGHRALTGVTPDWRFVVCESNPPYAVSVVGLSEWALDLADRKVERAIELWGRSLATDDWPGYSRQVTIVDPPAWEEAQFAEAVFD